MGLLTEAKTQHEKAIANKWRKMFEIELRCVKPTRFKNKIYKTVYSCETEEQLFNYYKNVRQYVQRFQNYDRQDFYMCMVDNMRRSNPFEEPSRLELLKERVMCWLVSSGLIPRRRL